MKKALVVDDSLVTRLMIRKIISEMGPDWEIREASSADEAWAIIQKSLPFDFLTIDQNMPGTLTGLDLIEKIKTLSSQQKIVLITANVQEQIRARAKSLDVLFLEKPVTLEKLKPLIPQS